MNGTAPFGLDEAALIAEIEQSKAEVEAGHTVPIEPALQRMRDMIELLEACEDTQVRA